MQGAVGRDFNSIQQLISLPLDALSTIGECLSAPVRRHVGPGNRVEPTLSLLIQAAERGDESAADALFSALYSELLDGAGVRLPPVAGESDAAHLYVIRTPERDRILTALAGQGISADIHYPIPDHRQE